jgi:hypothetical protein
MNNNNNNNMDNTQYANGDAYKFLKKEHKKRKSPKLTLNQIFDLKKKKKKITK